MMTMMMMRLLLIASDGVQAWSEGHSARPINGWPAFRRNRIGAGL